MSDQFKMTWERSTEENFKKVLSKLPIFHRLMTEVAATAKAEEIASGRGSRIVEEEDLLRAMFSEVPLQFYSLMIRILENVGLDYKKYNLHHRNNIKA